MLGYDKRRRIIQTVIQDHSLNTNSTNCVGPLVCAFFRVKPLERCKLVCSMRKKSICRPCGRQLIEHILESGNYSFQTYAQKQCDSLSYVGGHSNDRKKCSRIVFRNYPPLFHLCPDHICDFCVEEARKDMNRLVCLILCLQHTPGFKDLIGLISGFFCRVFDTGPRHLAKFKLVQICRPYRQPHYVHKLIEEYNL